MSSTFSWGAVMLWPRPRSAAPFVAPQLDRIARVLCVTRDLRPPFQLPIARISASPAPTLAGDFTTIAGPTYGANYGVQDGDVVKATVVGNVIRGYINGVEVISATDSTFSAGNPGVGFNYGVGSTNVDFGFKDFVATGL